jgi:hypothetical protein
VLLHPNGAPLVALTAPFEFAERVHFHHATTTIAVVDVGADRCELEAIEPQAVH